MCASRYVSTAATKTTTTLAKNMGLKYLNKKTPTLKASYYKILCCLQKKFDFKLTCLHLVCHQNAFFILIIILFLFFFKNFKNDLCSFFYCIFLVKYKLLYYVVYILLCIFLFLLLFFTKKHIEIFYAIL